MVTNEEILKKIKILELRLETIENFLSNFESFASEDIDDVLLPKAKKMVKEYDRASASLIQRRLSIGYARAARIIDQLTEKGIISSGIGALPREVLKK